MESVWFGVIATAIGVIANFVKAGIDYGAIKTRVDEQEKRLEKHEPTAVQIAQLSIQMTSLKETMEKVETNIDRLFERTNKRNGV